MQEVELDQDKDCKNPSYVGHPVQEVPVLMVEKVHVEANQLHLHNQEKVTLFNNL